MSATIFISYASRDRKVADSVCNALENRGLKCWISSRDIHGGENFQEAIVRAIRGAKVMLLIFSANANNSDELKKELVVAGQSKLIVVPLRVEEVTPNDAFSYELATRQWIDMFDNWERALDTLVSHLTAVLGTVAPAELPASLTAAPPQPASVSASAPKAETVPPPPKPPEKPAEAPPPIRPAAMAPPPVQQRPAPSASPTPAAPPQGPDARKRTVLIVAGGVLAAIILAWVGWTLYHGPGPKPPSEASNPTPPPNPAPAPNPTPPPSPKPTPNPAPNPVPPPNPSPKAGPTPNPSPSIAPAEANRRGEQAEDQKNYPEAVRLYKQAAEGGNARAQNNLGYLYSHGLGVDLDYNESMRWYRMAADQGDPLGQTNVGVLYQNGWSVNQDYSEALRWYRKAADQGFALADYRIGLMYENGLGVSKNLLIARAWMREASDHGNEDAKKWLSSHE
ncbi:MAG TPA: TIR domain-containing protein [Stellaceae bacterium]|nr:TIR domain-containing protein [Stellaceae bacterium]